MCFVTSWSRRGGGNYPMTWQGVCELLEDLEFSALTKQVQLLLQL